MKIAITGGAGFIGSHIADEYLRHGHEVVVLDNFSTGRKENLSSDVKIYEVDINSEEIPGIFKKEKFDILSHHAAQIDVRTSVEDPRFDANVNVIGSLNLYEAARKTGVKKVIFASTGGTIYGEQNYFPADEKHPLNPICPYAVAKLVNEKYLYYYKAVHGMDYVSLRYGNVYGPRQNFRGEAGVVAIFINRMLDHKQAIINGDGKTTRDYIYISDVVNANSAALGDSASGEYNVGTAKEHDVNYIFSTIKALLGSDMKEEHGPAKAGEQRRSVISYEKISHDLGWSPEVDFFEGLKITCDYFTNVRKHS